MRFQNIKIVWGIIALFLCGFATGHAQQKEDKQAVQAKEDRQRVTLDAYNRPFSEIIDGIREHTRKNIIYDDAINNILVKIKLVNVPWRTALEVIASKHGCVVEDIGSTAEEVIRISKPRRISMYFEEADIRDVINHIAKLADRNIILSDSVKGIVTLRIKDVSWEEALETIIKTYNYVLVKEKDGRILRIVPPQEIERQLETKTFPLRYIRPKSPYMANMSSAYFTKQQAPITQGPGQSNIEVSQFSLLNALNSVVTPGKGKITYDVGTNTLIITDVRPKLEKMEEIIKDLDKEPKQIFLDVKFISTSNSDIFDFGIDFVGGEDEAVRLSQSFGAMNTRLPFTLGRGGFEDAIAAAPKAQLDNEGFPNDADVVKAIEFGRLDFTSTKFTLRLLKKDVKSKIVQTPKIITLDHHEATIFVGRRVHFAKSAIVQNDNGTQSVELTEAANSPAVEGFQILVIPHIIPGTTKIQMTIIPSNDQLTGKTSPIVPGFNRFAVGGSTIDLPEVTQQVVVTHMILESGQTAVLGGLLKVVQSESVKKVPFLGDVPFLGYLFKTKSVTKSKEDLYIFVTPRIVQSAEDTQEKVNIMVDQERKKHNNQFRTIWTDGPELPEDKDKKQSEK